MSDPNELVQQAEKAFKGGSGLMRFFSGPDYDTASSLYTQAANAYKLQKDWQRATDCLLECALCAQKQGNKSDEAHNLQEAGSCAKRLSTTKAVEIYERAVAVLNGDGAFGRSAKLLLQCAEMLEADFSPQTADMYQRAADMFEMDDYGKSNFSKCVLKVAEFKARGDPPDYFEAAKIFESEGEKALQNQLLQYGAKEHFLRAGICHMAAGDSVTAKIKAEHYCALDPKFAQSA